MDADKWIYDPVPPLAANPVRTDPAVPDVTSVTSLVVACTF